MVTKMGISLCDQLIYGWKLHRFWPTLGLQKWTIDEIVRQGEIWDEIKSDDLTVHDKEFKGIKKNTTLKRRKTFLNGLASQSTKCQKIKASISNWNLKEIPVIMCTALYEAEDIAKASSYGVVDYVAKPFDFSELVEKISNVLGNKTLSEH